MSEQDNTPTKTVYCKRFFILITILAIIGAILPLGATTYFSLVRAKETEREKLSSFAERINQRIQILFNEAELALKSFENLQAPPCSEAHINLMRQATFNFRNINEVGYFEDGLLKCTSWGKTTERTEKSISNFTLPNGIEVTYTIYPLIALKHPVMALHYKNHNVLIDPARFADIIENQSIQVAIVTKEGKVISSVNDPSPQAIKEALMRDEQSESNFLFISQAPYFTTVIIEPRSYVLKKFYKELVVLLPLGFLIAILFVTLIIWISRQRLSPLGELKIAVAKREFILHYQPIIELKTGACIGVEALIRWRRPDGTLVNPDRFIPLAEESGLIFPITDQVLQLVVTDLNSLLIANRCAHVAINIAASDLKTGRILQSLKTIFSGTGIAPNQVWLEVTERGFVNTGSTKDTIERVRKMGYAVIIDDFGTGYSSLSYLHDLSLDALKIDKSFIDSLETESATSSVTYHIISIAKTLQLKMIAEGIETQPQVDYLIKHEVEYGQGWLFAKAMPIHEFLHFYESRQPPRDEDLAILG